MAKKRVFISCRIYEMREFREQAIAAIEEAGMQPMFFDSSDPKWALKPGVSLIHQLLEAVKTADVFLGLYGETLNTNWVPEEYGKHSMVLEYETADQAGLPCFCYTPPVDADFDQDMLAFREQVMQQKAVDLLSTPSELYENLLLKLRGLKSRLFVSYSSKDQLFVDELYSKLKKSGHYSWLNTKSIPKGDHWYDQMINGLLETELMILIISPDSMASKWVTEEWGTYINANKRILPILLKESDIPAELQKIEMIKEENNGWYYELLKAVEQNL